MSELITTMPNKRKLLKDMILKLHRGEAAESVQQELAKLLGEIPYGMVVDVEQELIREGLPTEEVLKLCDIHGKALKGLINLDEAKTAPSGHPLETFKQENIEINKLIASIRKITMELPQFVNKLSEISGDSYQTSPSILQVIEEINNRFKELRLMINSLTDIEKHYSRKENLMFPFLEKKGITGPPTVMWGKHDEIRKYLKQLIKRLSAIEVLIRDISSGDLSRAQNLIEALTKEIKQFLLEDVETTLSAIDEMIYKEEQILFPTTMDALTDEEWYSIYLQSPEIGFCLYDPKTKWEPSNLDKGKLAEILSGFQPTYEPKGDNDSDISNSSDLYGIEGKVHLPSGVLSMEELEAIFNTIPFDITFVDKDDYVRFFSQGKKRIFPRTRAILGRKVQMCHPPSSVHIVERILDDFKSGKQDKAVFWINMKGRFIHIAYYAVRNEEGEYLGTLEVSEDITEKRALKGERRILNYEDKD